MKYHGRDWQTILLGIASLGGALSAFTFGALIIVYSVFKLLREDYPQKATTFQDVVITSGIVLIGAVFLPAVYYSIQRLRGKEIPEASPKLLKTWQGLLLLLLWAGSAVLAQIWVDNDILKWFTPPLYLLATGTPVLFLIRLAGGGLNAGSRQRFWGVLVTSIALGVTFSIIAEMMLLFVGLLGMAGYLGLHPEQLAGFSQIADQITNASSIDVALNTVKPLLNNPLILLLALLFFSGVAPVIEEIAKSLAAWTIFARLDSPTQGFVVGALSGAGFGLFESLMASATPDSSWANTLMVRGGSTMMHIMAASITGLGIASLHTGKTGSRRVLRVIASYALAISMHGLWNAAAIVVEFGDLRTPSNASAPDLIGRIMEFSGISVLIILCLAIPLALGIINKRLRTAVPLIPIPLLENHPDSPPLDENGEKWKGVQ